MSRTDVSGSTLTTSLVITSAAVNMALSSPSCGLQPDAVGPGCVY
jgi:hypothetical protein